MESPDAQRGREAGQRRSPFDLIMNQIRRKRTATDRKSSSGRFLSRPSDGGGILEDKETEEREERQGGEGTVVPVPDSADQAESVCDMGWGRVCAFLQRLGKKADTRSLSLAHCDLTATDTLELATLLPCLSLLEEMDLSWNDLLGGSLRALTTHLQNVGGLRILRLCSCRLNADDVTALGEAMECVPVLEVLDLSWNVGVGGGALQGIVGKLHPTMRELHLVACQLTAADASVLGCIVSGLPRLCVLDVSCNPLLAEAEDGGSGGMVGLAPSLSHTPSLTMLNLHACSLMPHTLGILGGSLRGLPSLRALDLSGNKGMAGGLSLLTLHLAHLTRLESLDLHLCCLTLTDLDALIQALPSLPELTELDVSSNKAVGGVISALVLVLPLSQMRRLPLSGCSLNEESFTTLALAVPYLQSVDVSWCKVVGGRLSLLLDSLQPSVIQELHLNSCDLTTDDLLQLAALCKRGCFLSLRVLDLSYNGGVGEGGWAAFFGAAAGGLGSLEDLDLSLRPSSSAPSSTWLSSLLSALPRLPALSRLAAQRWTITPKGRDQLNHTLKKRSVLLEWDTPAPASLANRDVPEETHPEE